MPEILFRGKRKDNGEWVEGAVLRDGVAHRQWGREDLPFSDCYIVPKTDRDNIVTFLTQGILLKTVAHHVIPATIGQYIRLNDKNGKKAFTGDITMDTQGRKWEIFDCPGGFGTCNPWQWENHLSGDPTFLYSSMSDRQSADWFTRYNTIIGNIHDNPELLEDAAQ